LSKAISPATVTLADSSRLHIRAITKRRAKDKNMVMLPLTLILPS